MLQFVPVTDDLIESPNLPNHWQLVPYQVDHPCFRWSLCESPRPEVSDRSRPPSRPARRARKPE